MQSVREASRYQWGERILFMILFVGTLVICYFVPYSNGDDAYFYEMAQSMSLPEYLKMRYITWEGRMTSEAMTYVAFRLGHTFWSWANAFVLTLLPAGLLCMLKKITGARKQQELWAAMFCCLGIGLLGINVLGYGAIWITGSTFYLWSIVAGIWAAVPFVDLVWSGSYRKKSLIYAIPCGFIAAMGLEQITAVVIVFGILALLVYFYRTKRMCLPLIGEILMMIAAMAALFLSPGTEARTQSEIATWMPEFPFLSVPHHIFITIQWMLESLAKDGNILLATLWILLGISMWHRGRIWQRFCGGVSVLLAIVALLPVLGINGLTDLGTQVEDITQCVDQVALPSSLTGGQWAAFVFWAAAVFWTLWMLWMQGSDLLHKCFYVLLLLAGLASDAVMYFSPTMYASGARVHFMGEILLWFLLCVLLCEKRKKDLNALLWAVLLAALGIINVVSKMSVILPYFVG